MTCRAIDHECDLVNRKEKSRLPTSQFHRYPAIRKCPNMHYACNSKGSTNKRKKTSNKVFNFKLVSSNKAIFKFTFFGCKANF